VDVREGYVFAGGKWEEWRVRGRGTGEIFYRDGYQLEQRSGASGWMSDAGT